MTETKKTADQLRSARWFAPDDLPTGMQLMGGAYRENAVLAVARAYQARTDWHMHHPAEFA